MTDHSTVRNSDLKTATASKTDSEDETRAVNNLGYRGWSDRTSPGWMRWIVITLVGVRRAWLSRWVRRMLIFGWLPAVGFGIGFFIWEQAALYPDYRPMLQPFVQGLPQTPEVDVIREALRTNNFEDGRHAMWAWLLQSFFRYPQGVLMVLMVGMIAPPLISQDIRSRAFLLYFSRPLIRTEYLLGKLACLWAYLSMVSTMPALSLYIIGVLLSPSLDVVYATWDLPLRIVLASVLLMVPTSMLALCFSSLTQESRYAGFAWFAVWILGWFTYIAVAAAEAQRAFHGRNPNDPDLALAIEKNPWTNLSLYHVLGRAQRWVFGFADLNDVVVPLIILASVTIVSWAVLFRRISAPMRV